MGNRHSRQSDWQECRRYFIEQDGQTERDRDQAEMMLALVGKLMARRDIPGIEPSVDGGVLRLSLPYGDETLVVMPQRDRFVFQSPDAATDPHVECGVVDLDAMVGHVCEYARAGFSSHRAWEALRQRFVRPAGEDRHPADDSGTTLRTAPRTHPHLMAAVRLLSRDPRVNRLYPTASPVSLVLRRAPRGPHRPALTVIWNETGSFFLLLESGVEYPEVRPAEATRKTLAETVWKLWEGRG